MSKDDFRTRLKLLGWKDRRAIVEFGATERTFYRWKSGATPVPGCVARLLNIYLRERYPAMAPTDREGAAR